MAPALETETLLNDKPVTVRLPQDLLKDLMALSIVDDTTLAEQIRVAVRQYSTARRHSPELKDQIAAARAKQGDIFSSLAS